MSGLNHIQEKLSQWFQKNSKKNLEDFFTFLRFQSISTDAKYKEQTNLCANWVKTYLTDCNLETKLVDTPSYPVVFAENTGMKKGYTLLIYGHYDVQPVDPIELWRSDPFAPVIENETVYARGALDNKGQIFYVMLLMRALKELNIELPIHLKFCIEGEEESSSKGLSSILEKNKELFQADGLLVVDFDLPGKGEPGITLGAKGIVPLDVVVTASNTDLHSGHHGGIALNPIRALINLLSKIWDENGSIVIPNFYENVQSFDPNNYDLHFDEKQYINSFGVKAFCPEKGYSPLETNWFRPTIDINGIEGGYHQEGFKTVIPAKAKAKVSCRIVPNQTPKEVGEKISQFLKQNLQKNLEIEVDIHSGGGPISSDLNSPLAKWALKAYSEVFNKPCKKIMTGGSVPIIADMAKVLGCTPVMMGMGLAEDNIHAPNEHFGWDRMQTGFLVMAKILQLLANDASH